MSIPADLKYTNEHEWIRLEGKQGTIGITDFAQSQLGDVVFVDLPKVGSKIKRGETFGVVESVKTVSDLFAPADGTVVAINEELVKTPEMINREPYGKAWMIRLELDSPTQVSDLLDAKAYEKLTAEAH